MMAKSPRARRGVAVPPSDQVSVRHATQAQKPPPRNPTRAIREWLLAGLAMNGVTKDDVPPEVTF